MFANAQEAFVDEASFLRDRYAVTKYFRYYIEQTDLMTETDEYIGRDERGRDRVP